MDCKIRNFLSRLFASVLVLLLTLLLAAPFASAASPLSSYYDWGLYYNNVNVNKQVLGISFSSLEKLPAPTIPQDAILPQAQGILPGTPLYGFELLTENIQLAFTLNPIQRETQRLAFATERLSEIKTLVDQGQPDLAADAASIYRDTMDTVSKNVQTLSSQNAQGVADLVSKVEDTAASHAVAAQSLALTSAPNTTSSWNKVIDATEKVMDTTADVSGKPAIPEDLSTSIQELKEQGLITSEESNKLYALPNRTEVREELDKLVTSGQFPGAEIIKLDQAVAVNYPETYGQTQEILKFAELRTYETLPTPSTEILNEVRQWQREPGDTPLPGEIRPYLYYTRAQELAKEIDFSRFDAEQQSEVARSYPESVVQNPTFSAPSPSPSPTPAPSPTTDKADSAGSLQEDSAPVPSPTPQPVSVGPYLTDYKGPLPGTFGHFFKNIGEQARLATTFDPARRLEIEMSYADERLAEARALSQEKGKENLYNDTLKNYQATMDRISTDVKKFGGSEEDQADLARALESESARHNVVFEKGLLPPPTGDTKVYSAAINATEDAMDATSDVLGRSAIPIGLLDRLQDMKTQGIILPEEVSDLTNAKSREEVRDKVRELTKLGSFPPADAKKLDEAQSLVAPSDFNQLTEIRKIEELQSLRAVQAEFAQTATLRETGASYEQRVNSLLATIDPSLIRAEDLGGREELIKIYKEIAAKAPPRPINAGQFGLDIIPGQPVPSPTPPSRISDIGTCPVGALFKEGEGCVWEDTGKRINDYQQYRCDRPGQYWSFVSKACVAAEIGIGGIQEDAKPDCPLGYTWSWTTSSCAPSTGDIVIPSPSPEASPSPKSCPQGSSYKAPRGCVWDENDKPVYDQSQYRCATANSYYSFAQNECVPNPDPTKPFPDDAKPDCKENTYWNWTEGGCIPPPKPPTEIVEYLTPKPTFVTPDSPFYFLKQAAETVQVATTFGAQAREEVKLAQAKERFAEAYALLEKDNEKGFKDSLAKYTGAMQSVFNDIDKGLSLNEDDKKKLGEKLASEVSGQNLLLQKVSVLAGKDAATPISAATSVIIQGVDRASDLQGQPPIPEDIKEKLDSLPEDMLSKEQKQKLADADTRLEARLITGELAATGALTQVDLASLDNWAAPADLESTLRLNEFKKLSEAVELTSLKKDIAEKVEKTEGVAKKLDEFRKSFEPGNEIPADIRPYVRLTRIDEISQTVRPDIVRIGDFGNRKDIQLAVATLQQEFRPTRDDFRRLEGFRSSNPGSPLPPELARIEALSFSFGVRDSATACFLPSPPFSPNTPCPPSGAAIPIASYYSGAQSFPGIGGFGGERLIVDGDGFKGWRGGSSVSPSVDKDGKPLVYGKGPEAAKAGVCPDGYHWMYDSGGWCMSNSGNYSQSSTSSQTPYSSTPGYTPYSQYYSPTGTYQTGTGPGYDFPVYSPPNYYGTAPTSYTTNPPPGTVPGTGPAPTSPGQCPPDYHWMPDSGGWCMANGGTYTGSGGGGYYGGSVVPPQSCPPPSYWSSASNSCVSPSGTYNYPSYPSYSGTGGYNYPSGGQTYYPGSSTFYGPSSNLNQEICGPGYYSNGSGCYPNPTYSSPTYNTGGTSCGVGPPAGGCGTSAYWDYGSCSCRGSSTYSGGGGPSPSNSCQGLSCGGGSYLDYATCSCRYSTSGGGTSPTTSTTNNCSYPSGGCGGGWFDWGSCSCRTSSTSTTTTGGSTSTSGGSTSTSSGSCPSGYHWMSDNGGWCMSDGGGGGGSTSTYTPPTTSTTTSTPAPTTTTSEPAPAPTSSTPAPAPSEPAPAPAPTESTPAPAPNP